ncbi:MAG: PQQ-binding-like beta-propeller repeat protein, partial [Anaerolineae bacterium]|nr:PQQ-binding-like beta-propeller repeat protein [Anaerolineae bacterium]
LSTIGGEITAVRVGMPEIAWTFQCDGNVWASPVIFDGKVYIGDLSNKFYALDLQDGSLIWSVTLSAPNIGSAAILEDGLAVATEDGTVVALTTNGDKVWTRSIDGELYGSLVNYGEYLLVPATRGEVLLYALDANGNDRWSLVAPK